jgi:hypothetical protein
MGNRQRFRPRGFGFRPRGFGVALRSSEEQDRMKFDEEQWQAGPPAPVLSDPAIASLLGHETLLGARRLSFQLQICFDVKALLSMWDSESTPAWQDVARHAGGVIQRTLVKELTLTTSHLLDTRRDASSMVNYHRQCIEDNLKTGPFKSFYLPLYCAIIEKGKNLKPLRDEIIAHTNQEGLKGNLGQGAERKLASQLNVSDLYRLLTMMSWYVSLMHIVLGIGASQFEREIDGANSLRNAVIAAHEGRSSGQPLG